MSVDTDFEKSVELWVKGQKNRIQQLEVTIKYLKDEILLKQNLLELEIESLKHEKDFLENYLKSLEL
ncbi:hypothetical protein [Sulfuricurvum sp. MLSB]|uniref:hypothetical protein n=1 Tax=Sulfuricurvum sp. MLSB TaxID=1537917 RepID=UPI0025F176F2|nr:hypothetical protein [Sulfuricurvum sp. MLSB]